MRFFEVLTSIIIMLMSKFWRRVDLQVDAYVSRNMLSPSSGAEVTSPEGGDSKACHFST
jgi:hypothetical protein